MPNPTSPARQDFCNLAVHHSLIPVQRTLIADLETPVSAFLRLAGQPEDANTDQPEAFLLESVEGGERVGRYTFIGIEPYQRFTARGRSITHTTAAAAGATAPSRATSSPSLNANSLPTRPLASPVCRRSPLARSAFSPTISFVRSSACLRSRPTSSMCPTLT